MSAEATKLMGHSQHESGEWLRGIGIRITGRLKLGLYHRSIRHGLRRDLELDIEKPSAKIPIEVRPMVQGDLEPLFSTEGLDYAETLELVRRRAFVERFPKGCYVAIDQRDGKPCYMQWLIGCTDNQFIRSMGGFPQLRDDEALLENAYTPAKYRGLGIMSAAMALIAERADDLGANYVLTFVDQKNQASLKGCARAGFHPYLLHHRVQIGYGALNFDTFEGLVQTDPKLGLHF